MYEKLEGIIKRFDEIESLLAQPDVATDIELLSKLAKERSELETLVTAYRQAESTRAALEDAKAYAQGDDADMAALARDEIPALEEKLQQQEGVLREALLPRDPSDNKNVIVEIRAGTGGDEAALFAGDLYRMYVRYAQNRNWKVDVVDANETGQGGFKEVVFEVNGRGAYRAFRHESGVHRVQRVPVTEAQGRIHTSTATVAVLPEAEEVDVQVRSEDLRIDIFHSGGPGGQNVNKVATAVRLVHLPTGITVVCQSERSQLKNKTKAMTVLRSRLLERELQEQQQQTSAQRKEQVGSGERSEKIRTYNFPQDRLTDHRIGLTTHGLERILAGYIDPIIDRLLEDEQARRLGEDAA